jgi:hypothetical protein
MVKAVRGFDRAFLFCVQGIDASASWEQQRLIGRNCDGCLSQQEVQKADAAIAHLVHLVHGHGLSRLPQLDGIDDNYDDVIFCTTVGSSMVGFSKQVWEVLFHLFCLWSSLCMSLLLTVQRRCSL